jgi:hypothetical protein
MMFRFLQISMAAFFVAHLTSCVTPTTAGYQGLGGVDGEVVERSREKAPAWAGLRPFSFHEQAFTLGYVHVENQHPDLPLGIKKTQLNALLQGKDVFRDRLKASVSDAASSVRLSYDQVSSSAAFHLDEVSEQAWSANAKVADIFFEKFRPAVASKGIEEFYNIFVVVEVPKSVIADSLRNVARRFKSSGKPDLQKIGSAIDSMNSVAH